MSSILRGLNENNELLSEDKVALAELDKAAFEAEQALKSVDQVTKNIKYGTDTTEIIVGVQSIADTLKGFDHKELNYYEDKVREANNNLESAVYGLREPFNDLARDLRLKHDELEMDLEDIDEGQRCWKGYKKQGTKKMFGKTVNNCVKADESTDKDLADRVRDRQQQFKRDSTGDFWDHVVVRKGFSGLDKEKEERPLTWQQRQELKQLFPTESEDATRQGKLFARGSAGEGNISNRPTPPEYTTMVPKKIRTPGIYGKSYDGQMKGHALLKSFIEDGLTDEEIISLISDIEPGENKSKLAYRRAGSYMWPSRRPEGYDPEEETTTTNTLHGARLADQVREILPLMRKKLDPLQAWPMGPITQESEEVDEGMYDQDAFDAIFKDRKQPKKSKTTPQDIGMYNQPRQDDKKSNKDKKLDEFQRGSFDDDKPKRPSKGKLVTKDGMPVTLPLRTQDFRGDPIVIVDYIPPHKPSSTGRIVTDDGMTYFPGVADLKIIGHQFDVDEGLAGAASGAYLGSKIAGIPGAVAGGVLGHQATKEGKKSRIGSVMEMYDDYLFLIYINGKLAAETPIEKKQKNQYERVIKQALPDAEVTFKPTPRHYYSAEQLSEGSGKIRAGIAGILLLAGLLGINNHQAQKVYEKSHQLQQLTQVYMVAKERGDEAKMKEVKRRIGNHKMRLDLGKGDVDFDGLPGKDDIKDIDYINTPGEK